MAPLHDAEPVRRGDQGARIVHQPSEHLGADTTARAQRELGLVDHVDVAAGERATHEPDEGGGIRPEGARLSPSGAFRLEERQIGVGEQCIEIGHPACDPDARSHLEL